MRTALRPDGRWRRPGGRFERRLARMSAAFALRQHEAALTPRRTPPGGLRRSRPRSGAPRSERQPHPEPWSPWRCRFEAPRGRRSNRQSRPGSVETPLPSSPLCGSGTRSWCPLHGGDNGQQYHPHRGSSVVRRITGDTLASGVPEVAPHWLPDRVEPPPLSATLDLRPRPRPRARPRTRARARPRTRARSPGISERPSTIGTTAASKWASATASKHHHSHQDQCDRHEDEVPRRGGVGRRDEEVRHPPEVSARKVDFSVIHPVSAASRPNDDTRAVLLAPAAVEATAALDRLAPRDQLDWPPSRVTGQSGLKWPVGVGVTGFGSATARSGPVHRGPRCEGARVRAGQERCAHSPSVV